MEVFAFKLYEADVSAFVNVKAQKTPVLLLCDEAQRLTLEAMYKQYDGNKPFIFGDKKQLASGSLTAVKTDAPFVADKIMSFKKEIYNECLTFLGINNLMVEKAERLISDEASSNNELINLNLQSMLAPRLEACKQFNQKFNITDDEKKITVRVRSDLNNTIKNSLSIVKDYMPVIEELENDPSDDEGVENNE